jgi:hypothetical protein
MDCTCPTFPNAATELGACEFQIVSYDPEQRRVVRDIYPVTLTVNVKRNHNDLLSSIKALAYQRPDNKKSPEMYFPPETEEYFTQ